MTSADMNPTTAQVQYDVGAGVPLLFGESGTAVGVAAGVGVGVDVSAGVGVGVVLTAAPSTAQSLR